MGWRIVSTTRRWAIFAIAVGVILTTLLVIIKSGNEGVSLRVRLPDEASGLQRALRLDIEYGYIDGAIVVGYRAEFQGPISVSGSNDPHIIDHGISLAWILVIECTILFFLVPGFLTRKNQ